MGYYLSLDGVDDYVSTNFKIPSTNFTIEFDFTTPVTAIEQGFVAQYNGSDAGRFLFGTVSDGRVRFFVGGGTGILYSNTYLTNSTRYKVKAVMQDSSVSLYINDKLDAQLSSIANRVTQNYAMDVARYNNATKYFKGYIYSLKISDLSSNALLYYDMTLGQQVVGTVQDQSGNGYTGTLNNGSVWVSDGTTPTGTDVSYQYVLKQQIYADRTYTANMKQQIYSDRVNQFPIKQAFYADRSYAYSLEQVIYADRQTQFQTKQSIYADRSWTYPTEQQIYADYVLYSANFPIQVTIYKDVAQAFQTKQAIYKDRVYTVPTRQEWYKDVIVQAVTEQIIYADRNYPIATRQEIWADRAYVFAIMQQIIDPSLQIIGRIELKGQRDLYVYLQGRRDLRVNLKGSL